MNAKPILDPTCGSRTMWFNKNHPKVLYTDRRRESFEAEWKSTNKPSVRKCYVEPDEVVDFTDMPFESNTFDLVVFDPPHMKGLTDKSWTKKKYGVLPEDWRPLIHDGFHECMRVLRPNGTLIFKWSETQIGTRDVINAIGQEPLFGHRSGKKMNTHWLCFMKFEEEA